jgi:hypothetical protein
VDELSLKGAPNMSTTDPTKKYESLSAEKTQIIFDKILPLLEGWTILEIYDAADYIRSIVCSGGIVCMPDSPKDCYILGYRKTLHDFK